MTSKTFLEIIQLHKESLRNLILNYHPTNLKPRKDNEEIPPFITAPNAERACEVVREQIRQKTLLECPEIQFDIALQKSDIETLSSLLSCTWFGVPETTSCWNIPGFKVLVDLLDDPVEE